MDCGSPGSSVDGILQARILEWVAMPFSRGSSQPRDRTPCFLCLLHWRVGSLPPAPPGKPVYGVVSPISVVWGHESGAFSALTVDATNSTVPRARPPPQPEAPSPLNTCSAPLPQPQQQKLRFSLCVGGPRGLVYWDDSFCPSVTGSSH